MIYPAAYSFAIGDALKGPQVYETRAYVEKQGQWVYYPSLPWTRCASADEALQQALNFLEEELRSAASP
jgi:hypothetical protein